MGVQENTSPPHFEILPSGPEGVAIPAAAANIKKVELQIDPKFRVICGKFLSAKQERIFGAFVTVRGFCYCVYGNLKSNLFEGHLNLNPSITFYFENLFNIILFSLISFRTYIINFICMFITLTFRYRASCIQDRRFATLQRTLFIYLINKYISLCDICLTVHH